MNATAGIGRSASIVGPTTRSACHRQTENRAGQNAYDDGEQQSENAASKVCHVASRIEPSSSAPKPARRMSDGRDRNSKFNTPVRLLISQNRISRAGKLQGAQQCVAWSMPLQQAEQMMAMGEETSILPSFKLRPRARQLDIDLLDDPPGIGCASTKTRSPR